MHARDVYARGALVVGGGDEGEGQLVVLLFRLGRGWRRRRQQGRQRQRQGERLRRRRCSRERRARHHAGFWCLQQLLQAVAHCLAYVPAQDVTKRQ